MTGTSTGLRIDRYALLEEITGSSASPGIWFWRGHDTVLDREVSIRMLAQEDPRVPAFSGAARAAAMVEDRRLLRVLDVLSVPAFGDTPATIAVVSEWAKGKTLQEMLADGKWQPLPIDDAVVIAADVARAIAAGLGTHVNHGRLRPSSVIVTDAGEVRVRGLAVDAALWGTLTASTDRSRADVDSLGSLLYLLLTGAWSGAPLSSVPSAEQTAGQVLAPSRIRADVPKSLDDLVARSVAGAVRPKGMSNILDADGFYAALGVARDHVIPSRTRVSRPAILGIPPGLPQRLTGFGIAGLIVVAGLAVGWQLISSGPALWQPDATAQTDEVLTSTESTVEPSASPSGEVIMPVVAVQSFDPFGDSNRNGKIDKGKGRENEAEIPAILDVDPSNAWTSDSYRSADADGKGGVGIVLDLGRTQPVRAVDLDLGDLGASVEVKVSNDRPWDPQRWTLLATAPAGAPRIELRSPRPVSGRYVLVWFPEIPLQDSERFQVAVRSVTVAG